MRIILSILLIAGPFAQPIYDPSKILFWNGQSVVYPENTVSTFHSKWVNYLGEDDWREIDTNFYPAEGGFVMTRAPFKAFAPQFSDGEAVFHNDNKWDIVDRKEITDPPLDMTIRALKINKVEGKIVKGDLIVATGLQKNVNYVLYENAYRDADLIYYVDFGKEPRLMKLLRFHKKPKRFKYQFEIKYSDAVVFNSVAKWKKGGTRIFKGDNNSISVYKKGSDVRGIGFWKYRIWDSRIPELGEPERNIKDITVKMKYLGGNTFLQTKVLPKKFFNDAQYPVYTDTTSTFFPDPDPETTSVDGSVARSGVDESFSTIRSSGGNSIDDSSGTVNVLFSSSTTSSQYATMSRGIFLFDTSSLPDADTINSATLSLFLTTISNGFSGDASDESALVAVEATPASDVALDASDFAGVFNNGTTDFGRSDQQSLLTAGVYNTITLNALGEASIEVSSVTRFAVRQGWDFDNTTAGLLTWASSSSQGYRMDSAETAATAKDPLLTVNHGSVGRRIFYPVND